MWLENATGRDLVSCRPDVCQHVAFKPHFSGWSMDSNHEVCQHTIQPMYLLFHWRFCLLHVCLGTSLCVRTHGQTGGANCPTELPLWSNTWDTSRRSTNWAGQQHTHIQTQRYQNSRYFCFYVLNYIFQALVFLYSVGLSSVFFMTLNCFQSCCLFITDPKSSSASQRPCLPPRMHSRPGNTALVRAHSTPFYLVLTPLNLNRMVTTAICQTLLPLI